MNWNKFPPYTGFRFALVPDVYALAKEAKKRNWDISSALKEDFDGYTWSYKDGTTLYVLVLLQPPDKSLESISSILVHESVHVWQMLADHIGERTPGWEMEAYTIQYIFDTLFEDYLKTDEKTTSN